MRNRISAYQNPCLFFMSHLICKINLSPHYLSMVSISDSESVGLGSIPSGCISNFFPFFFLFFLLEVNNFFFFSSQLISKLNDISK